MIEELAQYTAALGNAHWGCGGDWQFLPRDWDKAGGKHMGTPVACGKPTCVTTAGSVGREIDLWVVPQHTRHRIMSVSLWQSLPTATHSCAWARAWGATPGSIGVRPRAPMLQRLGLCALCAVFPCACGRAFKRLRYGTDPKLKHSGARQNCGGALVPL